jgi:hypothetical protein
LIQFCNIILLGIQEKKKYLQQSANIPFIKKDSEPFTPTLFQLQMLPALEKMLSKMLSAHYF